MAADRRYRILMHLERYYRMRDAIVTDPAVTQEGMSLHTKIRQSHLSETLSKLQKEGLIFAKLAYIQGKKRKQKAYFLTEEGLKTVQKFELPTQQILFTDTLPKYSYFFGRTEETKLFKNWLASKKCKILVLNGIAGIGKTTFIGNCIRRFQADKHIFWYKVYESTTLHDICEKLAVFFTKVDVYTLKSYLMENVKIDLTKLMQILQASLSNINCMLVFDDIHTADARIIDFLKCFADICDKLPTTKLIVIGRKTPRFYTTFAKVDKLVVEYTLGGLDRNASFAILRRRNIAEHEFENLYKLTKGHPLALQLVEKPTDMLTESDLSKYVGDEIYSSLSKEEQKVLDFISVYRYPIPTELVYSYIPKKDYKIVESLIAKNLLLVFENAIGLHEILREYIYTRLPFVVKRKAHQLAADYYLKLHTDLGCIEGQYHLICGGDLKKALPLTAKYGTTLLSHGFVDEIAYVLSLLDKLDLKKIDPATAFEIFNLKGDVAELRGFWQDALSAYTEALKICPQAGIKSAEVCRKIGMIHQRMGEYEIAIQWFERWLATLGTEKKKIAPSKLYDTIAWVYCMHGDFETGLKYYKLSYKTASALNDLDEIGKTTANLAAYYYLTGNLKEALHYFKKSLEMRKKLNQLRELAAVHNNIGSVHELLGDFKSAEEHYNESLRILTNIDDVSNCAILYANLGTVAVRSNRLNDALQMFQKSIQICEKIGEKYGLALAQAGVAESMAGLNKLEEAETFCKKAIALSKKYSYVDLLGSCYSIYGIVDFAKGDLKTARKHLEQSIRIFEKINHKLQLGKAYYLIGRVLLAQNQPELQKTAKTYLEDAHRIFKTFGYEGEKQVLASIETILKKV